jgi:hypothetical protein
LRVSSRSKKDRVMTKTRIFLTGLAALFVAELLATAIHGFVLAADYAPYYGTLLRGGDSPSWQLVFLTVAHAAYIGGLVWIYSRIPFAGARVTQGLRLGLLGWVVGQVPLWLVWFAEQPWPSSLVVKQLALELGSSLIVGVTIAALARRADPNSTAAPARA